MYSFVNAVCLARSIGSQWHEVDLGPILVFDIFTTYAKVYLTLSHPDIHDNVYVDLDTLRVEFSSFNGTLEDLLIHLDNRTLATVPALPSTDVKAAKYSDAIRSQYKIDITKIGVVIPDNYPANELDDLKITRPKYPTDMHLLHSHCLLSVNGFYHMTDSDGSSAFVYNGAKTMRKSRMNHLGILSFLDIGAIEKVRIDPLLIYPQTPTSPLQEKIYFDVEQDLTNKSCILVLGGYLVFPSEGVFWQSGERTFALDIHQIPFPERLQESNLYMDLTSLGLSTLDPIDPLELYSDIVLKKYLTMMESYLVIVDTPNLITNQIFLRHSHLPGMFTSYQDPTLPLIVNYGKVAEYWKTLEDNHWSVTVQDSFLRQYVLSQQPIYQQLTINDHLLPHQPYQHSHGFLLEILGY